MLVKNYNTIKINYLHFYSIKKSLKVNFIFTSSGITKTPVVASNA
jgi:hypothetical protein